MQPKRNPDTSCRRTLLEPGGPPTSQAKHPQPVVVRTAVDIRSAALTVIAVLAVILVLQYAQAVLIPIVLGVLISYGLAPLVASLQRVHIPRGVGAAVAVAVFVGTLGLGVYSLTDDAMAIVGSIPEATLKIRERLRVFRRAPGDALEKMQQAATEIDKAAQEAADPVKPEPVAGAGRPAGRGHRSRHSRRATTCGTAASAWSASPGSSCSSCFSSTSPW